MKVPCVDELRARRTKKWMLFEEDVLPLWIAESDFCTCPEVKESIRRAVENESFGYPPPPVELQPAVADFYARHYGWHPNPQWIAAIPDVVRGLYLGIEYFTRPGSGIVVPVPAYPPFLMLPKATKRETHLISAEGGIDPKAVEAEFAQGAGALLLCSPFNPLGFMLEEETLKELADIADRYDARILVDEIHAPLTYDRPHICAASVSETAAKVCITVTATSKAWNIAGLKCAQMIFSNEEDVQRWEELPLLIREGVSTIGQIAATACYTHGDEFLKEQLPELKGLRDYICEELPKAVPGIKMTRPEATYLSWLDFRDTPLAEDPAGLLLKHGRIALNDGRDFGEPGVSHARFNFATSREILDEACERMHRAYLRLA